MNKNNNKKSRHYSGQYHPHSVLLIFRVYKLYAVFVAESQYGYISIDKYKRFLVVAETLIIKKTMIRRKSY